MSRPVTHFALVLTLFAAAACQETSDADAGEAGGATPAMSAAASADGSLAGQVPVLREATSRFEDVNVALAEGYIPDPSGMCITSEMEGAPRQLGSMGIHYLRPDLLGLAPPAPGGRVDGSGMHTDFNQPAVLLYEPQMDGSLALVAIENLVWAEPWEAAGNSAAPSYEGHDYYYMMDNAATTMDEAHGFEPHYELHLWVHRDNPRGASSPFNPAVTCDHAAM